MKTSITWSDTGNLRFERPIRATAAGRFPINPGRYLGLAAAGVLLAVGVFAALTAGDSTTRFQVLSALAAGLGLIQAWHGLDSGRLGRALIGGGAGIGVIALAVAAAPVNAGLLAAAFLIAGVGAAISHSRQTGLWVPTAALALTLAVLSLT